MGSGTGQLMSLRRAGKGGTGEMSSQCLLCFLPNFLRDV